MNKIPMLERFAAQSLVEHNGELIFSKEKFAELIVRECGEVAYIAYWKNPETVRGRHIEEHIRDHFGVRE